MVSGQFPVLNAGTARERIPADVGDFQQGQVGQEARAFDQTGQVGEGDVDGMGQIDRVDSPQVGLVVAALAQGLAGIFRLSCLMCGSFCGGLAAGEGGLVSGEGEHDEG
ncbi:hypothetical protein ACWD48_35765, partial [Streptomyces sp. NPDC002519]